MQERLKYGCNSGRRGARVARHLETPVPPREALSLRRGQAGLASPSARAEPEPPTVPPVPTSARGDSRSVASSPPPRAAPGGKRCGRPVLPHLYTVVSLFQRPVFMPATLSALARLMSYLLPLRPPLGLATLSG